MSVGSLKNDYLIYMYKKDLPLNNLQRLIYHKTKPNQTPKINILNVKKVLFQTIQISISTQGLFRHR